MRDRITLLADLLLGAAHADNQLQGTEKATVRRLLKEVLGGESLPLDLDFRIEEFEPGSFDLGEVGAAFANDPPESKRRLLELVAAVHAADEEFDLEEDAYLHRVGEAIGLDHASYEDLIVSVLDEVDLAENLEAVRFVASETGVRPPMPPPPGSKRARSSEDS